MEYFENGAVSREGPYKDGNPDGFTTWYFINGNLSSHGNYINGKFDLHQRVYRISDFVRLRGKFCYWYIKVNLQNETIKNSKRVTVDSIRLPLFLNFPIVFGSEEEQQEIENFLDTQTKQFDDLISKFQSQINFLQEKRQALITSAVTGKIDVRNGIA